MIPKTCERKVIADCLVGHPYCAVRVVPLCQGGEEMYCQGECWWNWTHSPFICIPFPLLNVDIMRSLCGGSPWGHEQFGWVSREALQSVSLPDILHTSRLSFFWSGCFRFRSMGWYSSISLVDSRTGPADIIAINTGQKGWVFHTGSTTTPLVWPCFIFFQTERRKTANSEPPPV